ncbi:hypothetical protein GC170_05970 [bacterium]|nr:hypothetical protein [bacterium]
MRSLYFDQFEFDEPASEECLRIDISHQSRDPLPEIGAFVAKILGDEAALALGDPIPFNRVDGRGQVCEHMKRFADIDIPEHVEWPTYCLVSGSWNEMHLVVCGTAFFIHYYWTTTA